MSQKAFLVLENGTIFQGVSFGATGEAAGEVVFTTGMGGYLETLTDPGYFGHIVVQTFPLIGNCGVISDDFESESISAKAYIINNLCQGPSNFRSEGDLGTFLLQQNIIGLSGIDTRQLTKIIRESGAMQGKIVLKDPAGVTFPKTPAQDCVAAVSTKEISTVGRGERLIALLDLGAKKSIAKSLAERGAKVITFPHNTTAAEILAANPNGIVLSNGPGDPANPANTPIIETIRTLMQSNIPIFGICLGHQLLAIANGYTTRKMKFGHRGANQSVKDLATGRIYATGQNHGYEVIAGNPSFININDRSCEGLDYGRSFSVQFHPGSSGGPKETDFLFDKFVERMDTYAAE